MGNEVSLAGIARELAAIKRLIIQKLLADGMPQDQVAKALGVNQSSISRMFATGRGQGARKQRQASPEGGESAGTTR